MNKHNTNWFIGDGNLVRDCEEKGTKNGNKLVKFRLAVKNGERKPTFIDCEWWNPNGASQYLKSGKEVSIAGQLLFEEWEGKNGEKKSKHFINIQNLRLGSSAKKTEGDYTKEDFEAEIESLIEE
jgi:single stranded DNA-binding protein